MSLALCSLKNDEMEIMRLSACKYLTFTVLRIYHSTVTFYVKPAATV